VSDYCGGCGERLKPHPVAGKLYCCSPMYWSHSIPLPADDRGYRVITGLKIKQQCAVQRPDGTWCIHHTLYLYRPTERARRATLAP
jgi:hypothetical protein